jgi:parvulin-like peptidyl-prolyl isomerase
MQGAASPDAGPAEPPPRVVTRLPPIGPQVNLSLILLSDKDVRVPWVPNRSKKRTAAEAEKIARRLSLEARRGADFAKLVKEWSDWPLAAQNEGKLGILVSGAGNLPELADAGLKLAMGEVSDPISTPFGYAVVKRIPLVRISHVVIGYAGVPGGKQTRTREEAQALATKVHDDIVSGKLSFADAAFTYSDEMVSAGRGGDIGSFDPKSPQLPQILKVAGSLKKGEVSPPFDSPAGFEIIERTE